MDNEYDLLSKDNEKYSIKIADYKARLRAIEKELHKETFTVYFGFYHFKQNEISNYRFEN